MTPLERADLLRLLAALVTSVPSLFARPRWSRERLEAYQLRLLKERLLDAKNRVPLYGRRSLPDPDAIRSLADWSKVPLLTKKDLLDHPVEERLHADYPRERLIVSKSSGSTGQALDVFYDRESFYLFVLAGLRLYRMAFPYQPWHRQTYIYTSPYPFDSLMGMYPMEFIPTINPIPDTLARLRRNPPDLLVCYPSHLRAIVDQMTPEDFRIVRPKVVNVNSEMSSAAERRYLGEKLGAFVFDDYSSEELTRIASQCRSGTYHVFDDINYMEVVDDEGRPLPDGVVGNLVGTNLHNRGMPLLRYVQGDRAALRTSACACGRSFRVLEHLEGRKNDAFLLPNGKTISSGFLLDLTYGVFLDYEQAVQAFCLIQDRTERWTLEVVPGSRWSDSLAREIPRAFREKLRLPEVEVDLKVVAQVTRTASGKANPILSRVKRDASA